MYAHCVCVYVCVFVLGDVIVLQRPTDWSVNEILVIGEFRPVYCKSAKGKETGVRYRTKPAKDHPTTTTTHPPSHPQWKKKKKLGLRGRRLEEESSQLRKQQVWERLGEGVGGREMRVYAGVCMLTSAVTRSCSVSSASAVKRVANFVIIIRVCPDALTVCISDTMQAL